MEVQISGIALSVKCSDQQKPRWYGFDMEAYCVYVHRNAQDDSIFYVGKGRGHRPTNYIGRNVDWLNIANTYGYKVEIVLDNLCDIDAKIIEFALTNELIDRGIPLVNKMGVVERKRLFHFGKEHDGEMYYPWRNVAFPYKCCLPMRRMRTEQCANVDELFAVLCGEIFVTHDGWTIARGGL